MLTSRILGTIKSIYRLMYPPVVTWSGDYKKWVHAEEDCEGYSSTEIADKAFTATLKSIDGSASYSRDGVCFEVAEYNWQLVSLVYRLRLKLGRTIRVLDFGGAFGDAFLQNAGLIGDSIASWTVIEQESMRIRAKNLPLVDKLTFKTLPDIDNGSIDLVLLSSVLQYLSEPDGIIAELVGLDADGILVDRTGFVPRNRNDDRITKQSVRPPIYTATYPCRFFSRPEFIKRFSPYSLVVEWSDSDLANIPSRFLGMYFEKSKE